MHRFSHQDLPMLSVFIVYKFSTYTHTFVFIWHRSCIAWVHDNNLWFKLNLTQAYETLNRRTVEPKCRIHHQTYAIMMVTDTLASSWSLAISNGCSGLNDITKHVYRVTTINSGLRVVTLYDMHIQVANIDPSLTQFGIFKIKLLTSVYFYLTSGWYSLFVISQAVCRNTWRLINLHTTLSNAFSSMDYNLVKSWWSSWREVNVCSGNGFVPKEHYLNLRWPTSLKYGGATRVQMINVYVFRSSVAWVCSPVTVCWIRPPAGLKRRNAEWKFGQYKLGIFPGRRSANTNVGQYRPGLTAGYACKGVAVGETSGVICLYTSNTWGKIGIMRWQLLFISNTAVISITLTQVKKFPAPRPPVNAAHDLSANINVDASASSK